MSLTGKRPTARQLSYLKALAERAGQSFAYPRTAADASREIQRLKAARPSSRTERDLEHFGDPTVREAIEDQAVIRSFEIVGYGSSSTWRRS